MRNLLAGVFWACCTGARLEPRILMGYLLHVQAQYPTLWKRVDAISGGIRGNLMMGSLTRVDEPQQEELRARERAFLELRAVSKQDRELIRHVVIDPFEAYKSECLALGSDLRIENVYRV